MVKVQGEETAFKRPEQAHILRNHCFQPGYSPLVIIHFEKSTARLYIRGMQLSTGSAQLEELVLPGGSRFQYSVHPFELKNAVSAVVAVLREYRFTTVSQDGAQPPMSLYKTEEGNWYDMPAAPVTRANLLLWQLKSAIDSKEAAELNSGNDFDA